MLIQVNSNNALSLNDKTIRWASDEVESVMVHFASRITRVEVHLNDVNSDKSGDGDKFCSVTARVEGLPLLATQHEAGTLEQALSGALNKLEKQIDRQIGKLDHKKGRTPYGGEPFAELPVDPNLPDIDE